jgi:hypothetical protein
MYRTLPKLMWAAIVCTGMSAASVRADVSIADLELGVSGSALQDRLAAQNAIFLVVSDTSIHARKLAELSPSDGNQLKFKEYTQFPASTEIKASLCDGKVFKIEFTSIYQKNFGTLMMARKDVFAYLIRGAAELTEIKVHQDEKISDVTETFTINRDALGGAQRGQERVTFALLESGGPQFNWVTLKFVLENKWYCPG